MQNSHLLSENEYLADKKNHYGNSAWPCQFYDIKKVLEHKTIKGNLQVALV